MAAVVLATDAACGSGGGSDHTMAGGPSDATVTFVPRIGARGVNPTTPVSVTVADGSVGDVVLTNAEGKHVSGIRSPDGKSFTVTEPLGYATTYMWSGTALGPDRQSVPVRGGFVTLAPKSTIAVNVQIADRATVGIAAPIVLQFNAHVVDKAAAERALSVTTTPPQSGGWAWLPDNDKGSRVHWRPRNYWLPGTEVVMRAKLYGVGYGEGAYGLSDLECAFGIGRSQVVKASVPSHRVQVYREGKILFDFPCSYGAGKQRRNTTRSGIHVATEKYREFSMSNPPFYTNAEEHWAVRISNNGEFIHANPKSVGAQGSANVTNGCINLSTADAETYFPTAMYGDPVEVSGTSIALSAADGDLYDWTIDWPTWQRMSALHGEAAPVASIAPAPTPSPPSTPR